jgi:hypothetical protein
MAINNTKLLLVLHTEREYWKDDYKIKVELLLTVYKRVTLVKNQAVLRIMLHMHSYPFRMC